MIRPQLLHRFVGYLEETAVHTYANIVHLTQTPGTQLHAAWKAGITKQGVANLGGGGSGGGPTGAAVLRDDGWHNTIQALLHTYCQHASHLDNVHLSALNAIQIRR